MENADDGGPFHPRGEVRGKNGKWQSAHPGISLRDWFAGQALAGMQASEIGRFVDIDKDSYFAQCCRIAYKFADAMLAERTKGV